jgi:hypothetical protein
MRISTLPEVLVAAWMVAGLPSSFGVMTLTLQNGSGAPITILDNGPGDLTSTQVGQITVMGALLGSVWQAFDVHAGLSKPVVGSQMDPRLDVLVNANSTGPGMLTITLVDTDFGPFAFGGGAAHLQGGGVTGGQVIASALVNNSVVAQIGQLRGGAWDRTATGSANGLDFSFSTGIQVVIHHTATGQSHTGGNIDLRIVPVPEPSTMLAGACLLLPFALGAVRQSRSSKRRTIQGS